MTTLEDHQVHWKDLLLRALRNLGGEAEMVDIYKWAEANRELPEKFLQDSGHQGRPRYPHILRSYASKMVKNHELVSVRRGRFRIPCAQ